MTTEKDLQNIKKHLDAAENSIIQAKSILFASEISKKVKDLNLEESTDVVEGVFDGEKMIGPDKKIYPVPANYASKSKLVFGDLLKLNVLPDGKFVFKQIGPVKRKNIIGELEEVSDNNFVVNVDNKKYRVLQASVTYFKAKSGDKLTITVPYEEETEWAAVENLLEKGTYNDRD